MSVATLDIVISKIIDSKTPDSAMVFYLLDLILCMARPQAYQVARDDRCRFPSWDKILKPQVFQRGHGARGCQARKVVFRQRPKKGPLS